mgnify:FL=1
MLIIRTIRMGANHLLQQSLGNEFDTLRPLIASDPTAAITPAGCLLLLGTPSHHTAYTLDALLKSPALSSPDAELLRGTDSDDAAYLGESTTLPELLHVDLTDDQYEALVLRMLGLPISHIPDDVKRSTSAILHDAGYTIAAPTTISELLTASTASATSTPTSNPTSNPTTTIDTTTAEQLITAPNADPTIDPNIPSDAVTDFPIRKLTPEEQETFRAHTRKRSETPPKRWPWSKMEVWDQVFIPSPLAVRAQRAVHAYSAISGHTYKTKRMDDGSLRVTRVDIEKTPRRNVSMQ